MFTNSTNGDPNSCLPMEMGFMFTNGDRDSCLLMVIRINLSQLGSRLIFLCGSGFMLNKGDPDYCLITQIRILIYQW